VSWADSEIRILPGYKVQYRIVNSDVGGVVAVWDKRKALHLPPKDFKHRWVMLQHLNGLQSPGGLSFETYTIARQQSQKIAAGDHPVKLKRLECTAESIEAPVPFWDKDQALPEDDEDDVEPVGSCRSESATARTSHVPPPVTPPSPSAAVAVIETLQVTGEQVRTTAELNEDVRQQLHRIGLDKVVDAIENGLEATSVVWISQEPDENGKIQKASIEIPDHKTRLSSAKMALEYLVGRPVERTEIIERKQIDYSEIQKRLGGSRAYRDEMRKILDSLDDSESITGAAEKAPDDSQPVEPPEEELS